MLIIYVSNALNLQCYYNVSSALNLQAGTVGAAGATDPVIASMLRSLTLIGPTMYRGNSNSLLLDAWAYYFGLALDSVRILIFVTLVSESKVCFSNLPQFFLDYMYL